MSLNGILKPRPPASRPRAFRRAALCVALAVGSAMARAELHFATGQTAYIVAQPKSELEQRVTNRFVDYVDRVLVQPPRLVRDLGAVPANIPAIVLTSDGTGLSERLAVPSDSPEAFALETREIGGHPVVVASGRTDRGLKRALQRLVIKSEQRAPGLVFPDLHVTEKPWIPRREWSAPMWSPELVRGVFTNPQADKRLNIWLYGDEQIQRYVEMFDWFGYSGGQLHETASGYALFGSAEAAQSRLKKYAGALRANGDNVTLWAWAAQFNGYGWIDDSVTYTPAAGKTAFTDPKVRAVFERAYDNYAKLAPDVDLLIAHFYDPGQLKNRADVFDYMRLLISKFRAINPQVKLGVDFWYAGAEADYMQQLIDHGFRDVLFLENTMPHTYPPGRREALHEEAKKRGLEMGVWGWHTVEIETDQNPNMHVNAKLLSHFYRQIRDGVNRIQPITYWSEMEAYHLNNIFSHYAAAQLLWNPDRDPDELLREITDGIWGSRNGPLVLAALQLIQDVRTGPTWDTYWIFLPTYRLGTPDAREDLRRAEAVIGSLEKMPTETGFVPKFPLPFPPSTFVELTLPHLRQIREFAAFRIQFSELEAAAQAGLSPEALAARMNATWNPIRDYSNWIGMFGPREAAVQEKMLTDFAREHHLELKPPGWLRWRDANRQLQSLQMRQRGSATPYQFKADATQLWREFLWPVEKGRDRFQLLVENGLVEKSGVDTYQLANWEEYRRR
jgi:hypothetical protein